MNYEPVLWGVALGAAGSIASAVWAIFRERSSSVPSVGHRFQLRRSSASRPFDVFVAYSAKDSGELAEKLTGALHDHEIKVWLDKEQVHLGDDLFEKISEGMNQSRYGLVILSPTFFNSDWSSRELEALLKGERDGSQPILPIWHGVSEREVLEHAPSLASKFAIISKDESVEELATAVAAVAHSEVPSEGTPAD